MERDKFVAEGKMDIGPMEWYFVFLDGEFLGKRLLDHFRLVGERGTTDLGRVRVTVERLDQGQA